MSLFFLFSPLTEASDLRCFLQVCAVLKKTPIQNQHCEMTIVTSFLHRVGVESFSKNCTVFDWCTAEFSPRTNYSSRRQFKLHELEALESLALNTTAVKLTSIFLCRN
ncbi:hypothetical protein BRADI_2g25355v3 [Brachypodium distachyon]|uniref:Uncharacterized protein n=1 Tax=Brachypodium distachyon TaxID=15368 RepID=A0A2K2DAF1_BRADI|nr:hypothetical protein BRADI_2g25355v3 [Brachypodium distachyon]